MYEQHGCSKTRLYKCWSSMRERCLNPRHKFYADYGGRGIFICKEWLFSYLLFEKWALLNGYREHLEINRIDNNLGYSPENCNWVTRKVNFNNRRATRNVTALGETKTIQQWMEDSRCRLDYATIWARLARGWSGERAITTPNRQPKDYRRN